VRRRDHGQHLVHQMQHSRRSGICQNAELQRSGNSACGAGVERDTTLLQLITAMMDHANHATVLHCPSLAIDKSSKHIHNLYEHIAVLFSRFTFAKYFCSAMFNKIDIRQYGNACR